LKTITIFVSPQGDTMIEVHGFEGGECRLATPKLRAALGSDISEQLKPEFLLRVSDASHFLVTGEPIGR
jgi:hypothetical protein